MSRIFFVVVNARICFPSAFSVVARVCCQKSVAGGRFGIQGTSLRGGSKENRNRKARRPAAA